MRNDGRITGVVRIVVGTNVIVGLSSIAECKRVGVVIVVNT